MATIIRVASEVVQMRREGLFPLYQLILAYNFELIYRLSRLAIAELCLEWEIVMLAEMTHWLIDSMHADESKSKLPEDWEERVMQLLQQSSRNWSHLGGI